MTKTKQDAAPGQLGYDRVVKAERAIKATAGRFWLPTRPYNIITELHALVGEAMSNERHGIVTTHHLFTSKTAQEYRVKCERAFFAQWGATKVCELTGPQGEYAMFASGGPSRAGKAIVATYERDGSRKPSSWNGPKYNISNCDIGVARETYRQLVAAGYTKVQP